MYSGIEWRPCPVLKSRPNKFLQGCQVQPLFPTDFCLHWVHVVRSTAGWGTSVSLKRNGIWKTSWFSCCGFGWRRWYQCVWFQSARKHSCWTSGQKGENAFAAFESEKRRKLKIMVTYPKQTLVAKRMPKPGAELLWEWLFSGHGGDGLPEKCTFCTCGIILKPGLETLKKRRRFARDLA